MQNLNKIKEQVLTTLNHKNIRSLSEDGIIKIIKRSMSCEIPDNDIKSAIYDLVYSHKIGCINKVSCPKCDYLSFEFTDLNDIKPYTEYICRRCGEEVMGNEIAYDHNINYYTYYYCEKG